MTSVWPGSCTITPRQRQPPAPGRGAATGMPIAADNWTPFPLPMPPSKPPTRPSDRLVRLQIFLAFTVPLLLVIGWLSSRGFFGAA